MRVTAGGLLLVVVGLFVWRVPRHPHRDFQRQWMRAQLATLVPVLRRPGLWWTAVRFVFTLGPNGWADAWPPLPIPDRTYWRFRMQTVYGFPDVNPPAEDAIEFLAWCKDYRRKAMR